MMTEREYLAAKAKLKDEARAIHAAAEAEQRDLTEDEQKRFDGIMGNDEKKVVGKIQQLDARWARAQALAEEPEDELSGTSVKPRGAPGVIRSRGDRNNFNRAVASYLRDGDLGGARELGMLTREGDKVGLEIRASNATDMNIGTAVDGGYAVPTGFFPEIIAKRSEMSLADRLGLRKIPGKGTTVNVPYDNETDGEFISTAEAGQFDLDAPALGQAALTLVKYTKYIKLSVELLADEDASLMAFLTDWIARGQAKTMNNLLLTEVAANGTSLKTTASATAIAAGEPEGVVFNDTIGDYLDDSPSVDWVMKPSTYGAIVSVTGNPRLYVGGEDMAMIRKTLLGYPVFWSSKAGAVTSAQKSAYFGNWNFVGWREEPGFTLLRDPYSAANTGQVVLWMYFRTVFKVLQPSAIGYLLQAT